MSRIIGIGVPRSGTGYTAAMLRYWGYDVGHERMGSQGMVSWSAGVPFKRAPWGDTLKSFRADDFIIHIQRHPQLVISSLHGNTWQFRSRRRKLMNFVEDVGIELPPFQNPLAYLLDFYLEWNHRCILNSVTTWKVEDSSNWTLSLITSEYGPAPSWSERTPSEVYNNYKPPNTFNHKRDYEVQTMDVITKQCDPMAVTQLLQMMSEQGYDPIT